VINTKIGRAVVEQGCVAGMTLLSVVLAARMLDERAFALYVQVQAAIYFPFLSCSVLWANPTLVFLPKRFAAHARSYGRAIYLGNVLTMAAIALATLVLFHAFYRRVDPLTGLAAWLAALAWSHYDCRRRIAYAMHRGAVMMVPSASVVVSFALIAFSAWRLGRLTVASAFFAMAASYVLADVLASVLLRRHQVELDDGRAPTALGVAGLHWRYARWTLASIPPSYVCNQGYFILAGALLTDAELGGFRSVHILLSSTSVITAVFVNHSLPRTAEILHREGLGAFQRHVDTMYSRTWLPFLGLQAVAAAATFLSFGTLYGGRYASAVGLIPILAAYQYVISLRLPAEVAWGSLEKLFVPFAGHLLSAVVACTLGIVLITRAGAAGASVGLLLTGATNVSILYFALRRELQSLSPSDEESGLMASSTGPARSS
jgi:O-antigen/teichoic acid export membrane protein